MLQNKLTVLRRPFPKLMQSLRLLIYCERSYNAFNHTILITLSKFQRTKD